MYSQSEKFLVLGLLVVLLLAGEAGYRYGRKSRARSQRRRSLGRPGTHESDQGSGAAP